MSGKPTIIDVLMDEVLMWPFDKALHADELDKMWADFGRRVQYNLMHPDLLIALNRACLTCSNHIELAAAVRAFLLTGAMPHARPHK